jgi:hypothetical protein
MKIYTIPHDDPQLTVKSINFYNTYFSTLLSMGMVLSTVDVFASVSYYKLTTKMGVLYLEMITSKFPQIIYWTEHLTVHY